MCAPSSALALLSWPRYLLFCFPSLFCFFLRRHATLSHISAQGLVEGASEGAGLGNAFLSNIQAVDGMFHGECDKRGLGGRGAWVAVRVVAREGGYG